jgi:alpha-glucosidase (family GH31 glycosyl hydrolase)
LFGDDFLVAPIYRDDLKSKVTLPPGKWRYFFEDKEVLSGPVTFERVFPMDEYPVYIREGAIVPLNIERNYTGFGDETSKGFMTWLIYPENGTGFKVHHPEGLGSSEINVTTKSGGIEIKLSETKKPSVLLIHLEKKPRKVYFNQKSLIDSLDFNYDSVHRKLKLKLNSTDDGNIIIGLQELY